MPSSSPLPLEARQAAWSRLWQVLLREPPNDEVGKREPKSGSKSPDTDEATARAPPEGGDDGRRVRESPDQWAWSRLRMPGTGVRRARVRIPHPRIVGMWTGHLRNIQRRC